MRIALGIVAVSAVLCGCAPSALRGNGSLSQLTPGEAAAADAEGQRVRWGGVIAATNPQQYETCFDVISKPLDSRYQPRDTDDTMGRFRACATGFYDPGIYEPGRLLTVIGTVRGTVPVQVGEYKLEYPLVTAETVYLWRERQERTYYPYPSFWFGYPYGFWGFRHPVYRKH